MAYAMAIAWGCRVVGCEELPDTRRAMAQSHGHGNPLPTP